MANLPTFARGDAPSAGRSQLRTTTSQAGIRRAAASSPPAGMAYSSGGATVLIASWGQILPAQTFGDVGAGMEAMAGDGLPEATAMPFGAEGSPMTEAAPTMAGEAEALVEADEVEEFASSAEAVYTGDDEAGGPAPG